MRSGGFPCRFAGCRRTFPTEHHCTLAALNEAYEARTAHEIADHDYHHVILQGIVTHSPYVLRKPKTDA